MLCLCLLCVFAVACGPQHLSALGNPGDYCTESSACTDGTQCRATDDGYRCVGAERENTSAAPARRQVEESIDDDGPGPAVGTDESVNSDDEIFQVENDEVMDFDDEEEPGAEEYAPPSRRRRGSR